MMIESPAAPVREFVLRYAPEALRPGVEALFTVERELAATARDGLDHAVAHARLDWWDEELERRERDLQELQKDRTEGESPLCVYVCAVLPYNASR